MLAASGDAAANRFGAAGAERFRARQPDSSHAAASFLRSTTGDARRTLCTAPGSRPALNALGEVLERGHIPRPLLQKVISNPHAQPYLVDTLRALRKVDTVPGVTSVLEKLASGRNDGSVKGPAFEVMAGAAIGRRLKSLSSVIDGHEVDALLHDGTRVEIKNQRSGYIPTVRKQLERRCQGKFPGMVIVPNEPHPTQLERLRKLAPLAGGKLELVVVDRNSLTARSVRLGGEQRLNERRGPVVKLEEVPRRLADTPRRAAPRAGSVEGPQVFSKSRLGPRPHSDVPVGPTKLRSLMALETSSR